MIYIKYADYNGQINENEMVLMSHDEFVNGGKDITNVPVCITPDGSEPREVEYENGLEQLYDCL